MPLASAPIESTTAATTSCDARRPSRPMGSISISIPTRSARSGRVGTKPRRAACSAATCWLRTATFVRHGGTFRALSHSSVRQPRPDDPLQRYTGTRPVATGRVMYQQAGGRLFYGERSGRRTVEPRRTVGLAVIAIIVLAGCGSGSARGDVTPPSTTPTTVARTTPTTRPPRVTTTRPPRTTTTGPDITRPREWSDP